MRIELPEPWKNYWERVLDGKRVDDLLAKYRELLKLGEMTSGNARKMRLAKVAADWPGSLREAELAGPEVCRVRRDGLLIAPSSSQSYGYWRSVGFACLPLWSDLHAMVREQLQWRRERNPSQRSVRDFCEYVCEHSGTKDRYWPEPEQLSQWAGSSVRPRQAYLWLAAWAGLSLAELNLLLLARVGPWDHHVSDPKWTMG